MSDLQAQAVRAAQSAALTADDAPRTVARALQEPLVAALGHTAAERLAQVDRRFASRVARWESGADKPARGPRLVTPWPDLPALLAVASAMGAAAGAGRLTGGTALNSLPVVAPTVIISLGIAFVLLAVGAIFARRERETLLAQYEDSAAVVRSGYLWATTALAVVTLIAMIVRLATDDVIPSAIIATALSGVAVAVTLLLAVSAQRLANASAAGGKLIHVARGSAHGRQRNEAISASEDARDEAAEVLESSSVRDQLSDAYAAAVAEVTARRVLPPQTVKRLAPTDWIAARYDVEV